MYLAAALVLSLLVVGEAAVHLEVQNIAPGKPQVCKYNGRTYKVGEKWRNPTECEEIKCEARDAKTVVLYFQGCGVVAGPQNCRVVEDKRKPYPQCCPTLKCH